jgi:glycerophosphoryl diester phosphodiesterase
MNNKIRGRECNLIAYFNNTFPKPIVFGHRGACEEFPENTILSFDMAIKQGAVGIETDLQCTKDSQIVCFHDQYLGRLSTMQGSIHNTTLKDLAKARIKHNSIASQSIPTLIELLEWLPEDAFLILDLKDFRFRELGMMDSFINTLAKYNVLPKIYLASFSLTVLEQVKKVLPSMPTCFITLFNFSPYINADIMTPYFPILWLNPSYVEKVHRTNRIIAVWDTHPEHRINHYIDQRIDIVTVNNPQKILGAISNALHGKN